MPPAPASAASGPDWKAALRDASFAALVAFGLFSFLVGLKTDQTLNNQMVLVPRLGLLAGLCAAVFAGRLLISAFVWQRSFRPRKRIATAADTEAAARLGSAAGIVLLAAAFIMPALALMSVRPLSNSLFWIDLGILILTYVMLGWGLNIVVGLAGLLDLGYVAFYAIGAYTYALLATSEPIKEFFAGIIGPDFWPLWAFWLLLPVAGVLAALWGVILGFPVLRLRGDYLAIVTLAFGEIIRLVAINWVGLTNGYAGVSSVPRITFFGIPFNASEQGFAARAGIEFFPTHRSYFLYYVILILALLTYFVTMRLRRLPLGRAWEALREDEIACRSLGLNTTNTKLTAFAIGAMFAGMAGCFFGVRQGFVSPESFRFEESAIILAIVVLGGMGSMMGVVIASAVLIGGMELLRNLEFLKLIFGDTFDPTHYRMLIFGLAMVGMMIWKPRGLVSTREPTVFLKQRKAISGSLVKEGHG